MRGFQTTVVEMLCLCSSDARDYQRFFEALDLFLVLFVCSCIRIKASLSQCDCSFFCSVSLVLFNFLNYETKTFLNVSPRLLEPLIH